MTFTKQLSLAFVAAMGLAAPAIALAAEWTEPTFIEGRGVTNCGMARADSDVRARCASIAETRTAESTAYEYRVLNIDITNFADEYDRSWDGRRSCVYRANFSCELGRRAKADFE